MPGNEKARALLMLKDIVDAPVDIGRIGSFGGHVPLGEEGHPDERRDSCGGSVVLWKTAVSLLGLGEKLQSSFYRRIHLAFPLRENRLGDLLGVRTSDRQQQNTSRSKKHSPYSHSIHHVSF
mgnify:CR=1 FL=1